MDMILQGMSMSLYRTANQSGSWLIQPQPNALLPRSRQLIFLSYLLSWRCF